MIELNFFNFIIGNFFVELIFFGFVYFVLDFRSIDFSIVIKMRKMLELQIFL